MAKHLVLWEIIPETMPTDPAERAKIYGKWMELTQKGKSGGKLLDWGVFSSGNGGYSISDMTPEEGFANALQYAPYIKFTAYTVLSLEQVAKVMQSMPK
jgi:hypothetical protein